MPAGACRREQRERRGVPSGSAPLLTATATYVEPAARVLSRQPWTLAPHPSIGAKSPGIIQKYIVQIHSSTHAPLLCALLVCMAERSDASSTARRQLTAAPAATRHPTANPGSAAFGGAGRKPPVIPRPSVHSHRDSFIGRSTGVRFAELFQYRDRGCAPAVRAGTRPHRRRPMCPGVRGEQAPGAEVRRASDLHQPARNRRSTAAVPGAIPSTEQHARSLEEAMPM